MGQGQSNTGPDPRSNEELARELADKFARQCFSKIELYSLKENFKSLADNEHGVKYLKEDTIAKFLEIPDILGVMAVIFQMVSYIGAFPFLQDAPAVLSLEQMVIVITLLTERYRRVLARGSVDRRKLLFKSLAVYDRKLSEMEHHDHDRAEEAAHPGSSSLLLGSGTDPEGGGGPKTHAPGFSVDEPGEDEEAEDGAADGEDDDLVLAAFESLDYIGAFKHGNTPTTHGAMIPADNFRKLIMLLLLMAPLGPQERLSQYSNRTVAGPELDSLRSTAESILAAFLNVEKSPGIKFHSFNTVIPTCFPYLFDGFNPLFEHFLFSKTLEWKHQQKPTQPPPTKDSVVGGGGGGSGSSIPGSAPPPTTTAAAAPGPEAVQPLLQDQASILNLNVLSQLSFFLPGSSLFRRLRLLYSGADDGFSLGAFETKVFNWRAPTILLVSGTRIADVPQGGQQTAFAASLPPRRFPHGNSRSSSSSRSNHRHGDDDDEEEDEDRLVFGIYIDQPWKITHRECFGGAGCTLFQLAPIHDVFPAATLNTDYVSFTRSSPATGNSSHPGIALGCPAPNAAAAAASTTSAAGYHHLRRRSTGAGTTTTLALGTVSLRLDPSFEFGVFTHDYGSRGAGAFQTSVVRRFNFQDRFEVESLEVWGCGGDDEARAQAERWAWEAREAEARRRINLGTGDIEADRALLEMAGLVGGGGNRSGGSMG